MEQKTKKETSFYQKVIWHAPQKMRQAHFHQKHEFYCLLNGKTKYFIGNEIFLLDAGDMIFVPKNTFHKTDSGEVAGVERILFTFDEAFLGEDIQKYLQPLYEKKLIRLPQDKRHEVQAIFNQLEIEERKQQPDYLEMQRLYFRQLLILILRYSAVQSKPKLDPTYLFVQDVAKYVSEHPNAELSLHRLSLHFAVSPSHLSRTFKQSTGVGLNEYINISRITAAERLLIHTSKSITEVSDACGFHDSNYFSAVFKRIKGVTPKKYALMHGKRAL